MMAAIGLTIIVKQLPVIMGVTPISKSAVGQLIELPMIIVRANPAVTLIGLASLFVLLMYDTMKGAWKRWMPAPIAAVAVATSFAAFFGFGSSESYQMLGKTYSLGTKYLVNLPQNVFSTLGAPDFSHLGSREFLIVVLTIALVGSLETLLSAAAVERLDPDRRRSDLDKDLLAVGVGTAVSGLAGGLPMIAEIVRSSANVNAGAKSGWANFFHGVYLLAAILFFPAILRHVPLAALAALLVFTGYRLASPM
jgi:MFS superfamily sulfate permease-like transporter